MQLAPPAEGIATNFHAGLYLLQMLLLEEFSKQSTELSRLGFVRITEERWRSLLAQAGIPSKMLDHIRQTFIEGQGKSAPSILKQEGNEIYSLAQAYEKQSQFLIEQGNLRQQQASRGKRGANKKWNL